MGLLWLTLEVHKFFADKYASLSYLTLGSYLRNTLSGHNGMLVDTSDVGITAQSYNDDM